MVSSSAGSVSDILQDLSKLKCKFQNKDNCKWVNFVIWTISMFPSNFRIGIDFRQKKGKLFFFLKIGDCLGWRGGRVWIKLDYHISSVRCKLTLDLDSRDTPVKLDHLCKIKINNSNCRKLIENMTIVVLYFRPVII